jgi:uncharacterized protein CbrC (UPF0167 family)
MIRLHVIAEGQTEEEFVNTVLAEHLGYFNISTSVHCITTKRTKNKVYRGGLTSYEKVKKDINLWLKQDRSDNARFTTMLDLYALPNEFPEFNEANNKSDPYQKINHLENAFSRDINDLRFIPYIQLHEFEALVLVKPEQLKERFPEYEQQIQDLLNICCRFTSPELINQGATTAPSKRIFQFVPTYEKVSAGSLIVQKIGLASIREKCPHFNQWITQLENLRI